MKNPTKTGSIPVLQAGTMVMIKEPTVAIKETPPLTAAPRPRPTPAAKKSKEPTKPPQDSDAVFPCKKCSRYGPNIHMKIGVYNRFPQIQAQRSSSKVTVNRRSGVSLSCCCHQVRGKCVVSSVVLSRAVVEGVWCVC